MSHMREKIPGLPRSLCNQKLHRPGNARLCHGIVVVVKYQFFGVCYQSSSHTDQLQNQCCKYTMASLVQTHLGSHNERSFFFPVAILEGTFQYFEVNRDQFFHVIEYLPLTDMTKCSYCSVLHICPPFCNFSTSRKHMGAYTHELTFISRIRPHLSVHI